MHIFAIQQKQYLIQQFDAEISSNKLEMVSLFYV